MRPQTVSDEALMHLYRMGHSYADIGRMVHISRQAVAKRLQALVGYTMRYEIRQNLPWRLRPEWWPSTIQRALLDHAAWLQTRGEGMSDRRLADLRRFYDRLDREGLVVVCDADIPPGDYDSVGGYALVPREPEDEDLLLRRNDHVVYSDDNIGLWRLPEKRHRPSVYKREEGEG